MRAARLIPAIAAVVVVGAAAAIAGLSGGSNGAGPGGAGDPAGFSGLPGFASYQPIQGCIEAVPAAVVEPAFRPSTLTLPDGSITIDTREDPAPGLHIVVYAVPTTLDAFVEHVLEAWPAAGWELGRGEREPGEAESVFYRPDKSRYGQFRARSVYCDLETIELTLTLGEDVRASSP